MATNHSLTIDGVAMPEPSKFTITLNDLDSDQTGRSIDGNLHRDVIGTNFRTIELEWKTMTRSDLQKLLNAISKTMFEVTYYDPIQDAKIKKYMYAGNRKIDMYNYIIDNGKPLWINISVSFIQVNNNKTEPDRKA